MPIFELGTSLSFPHPSLADYNGILAVGGDLSPQRLILAYENGIFPWYNEDDPIIWWSPPERMVLDPAELKVSKSMKKAIKDERFEFRVDSAFEQTIKACSSTPRPGQQGTWLNQEMIDAYVNLHDDGYAHSFESWRDGKLVGGLYGLSLGKVFFGESMFSHESEASKLALYQLCEFSIKQDFHFIDCQVYTDHLSSLGAKLISRNDYLERLKQALAFPDMDRKWEYS